MNFRLEGDNQLTRMVACCAGWMDRLRDGEQGSWLSLLGKSGTGKTHCATWMWKWAEARFDWHRCEFVHHPIYWPKFVAELREGIGYSQLMDMTRWPVLFLDDMGAERDEHGFSSEKLNMLLGSRVGKWTIITSNLLLPQIESIDARIADRIVREQGSKFIQVTTKSYGVRAIEKAK